MHLQGPNATAHVRERAFEGDESMKVQCEGCKANGQVSDEAELRAVLWICGSCGVRYLVSSRGMRKAPLPPPPPKRRAPSSNKELPPGLAIEGAVPEAVAATVSEGPGEPKAPVNQDASALPSRHLADIPIAKNVQGTPSPSLALFNSNAPVVPSYPVLNVPVHDPLWRRPALLASALAGLLVGLAAYGVQWTREQVRNYEPSVATAAAAPHESSPATPVVGESEETEAIEVEEAEPTQGSEHSQRAIGDEAESQAASPPSKTARKAPPSRPVTARTRTKEPPPPRPAEPVTVAAVAQPQPEVVAPPKSAEPTSFGEAMARAVDHPASSEPQAKAQPGSNANSAGLDAYTPFSRDAALSALSSAAASASRCRSNEGPFGAARIAVTFAPSGQATTAVVEGPPFAGTPVGSCIARAFREARVTPFSGAPVTVRKSMSIF